MLSFDGCSALRTLSPNSTCGGEFSVRGCRDLKTLDFPASMGVDIRKSGVAQLGKNFRCKTLRADPGTKIRTVNPAIVCPGAEVTIVGEVVSNIEF